MLTMLNNKWKIWAKDGITKMVTTHPEVNVWTKFPDNSSNNGNLVVALEVRQVKWFSSTVRPDSERLKELG